MAVVQDYASIEGKMRSLDLILFKGTNVVSKAILKIESYEDKVDAEYSHAGMCIQGKHLLPCVREEEKAWLKEDGLYIFESIMSGGLNDGVKDVSGHCHLAVQLRHMGDVARANSGSAIAWCPLKEGLRPKDDAEFAAKMRASYDRYLGITYDASVVDLTAAACPAMRWFRDCSPLRWLGDLFSSGKRNADGAELPNDNKPSRWQFCSELVANVYKDMGIISPSVDPRDVMPQDFVPKPGGRETYDADKQVPVLFEGVVPYSAAPIQKM